MIDKQDEAEIRPLEIGEPIQDGDIYLHDGIYYPATDTGNGVMSDNHCPHFRHNAQADL